MHTYYWDCYYLHSFCTVYRIDSFISIIACKCRTHVYEPQPARLLIMIAHPHPHIFHIPGRDELHNNRTPPLAKAGQGRAGKAQGSAGQGHVHSAQGTGRGASRFAWKAVGSLLRLRPSSSKVGGAAAHVMGLRAAMQVLVIN
jgi:hypothetical protein